MPWCALQYAALRGHTEMVRASIDGGVDVDCCDEDGDTPLLLAVLNGHFHTATVLLESNADASHSDKDGHTPMSCACQYGHLATAKLLSSYGASRQFYLSFKGPHETAEELAEFHGHLTLAAWLRDSCKWTTPLHHIAVISTSRTLALLRAGASINAKDQEGDPTPLALACELHAKGEATNGTPAALVLKAAQPWSPETHALFPAAARAYAVQMMLIGHSKSARLPVDLWLHIIMPYLISRDSK